MWQQRKPIITEIENKRQSRLICYLTSDRAGAQALVARDVLPLFFNQLLSFKDLKRLDILMFTAGGDSLAAFALARMIREFVGWVGVLVPDKCHSAGTLFALGANEIFMTRAGTLSPIDPSVQTPFNPWVETPVAGQRQQVPVSVESVAGFKDLVTDEWGIKNEALIAEAFKLLAGEVPPLALGDVYRRRQQIEQLAGRLLKQHRNDEGRISELIVALTKGLGSHDYPISRSEARVLFGEGQIAPDDRDLEGLVWKLFEDYAKDLNLGIPYNAATTFQQLRGSADQDGKVHVKQNLALIENAQTRDVFEQEILLSEIQAQAPSRLKGAELRAIRQEVVDAGWKNYRGA